MIPIEVTAKLQGPISLPNGPLAIDALLAAAVCIRDNVPPALTPAELVPIEIPVQREPGGRFHLASFSMGTIEERERHWINRRFPVSEAQMFGDAKLKRLDISTGPSKSYRLPLETGHLEEDELRWWLIGDYWPINNLLSLIGYLGKKRSVGNGRVKQWSVTSIADKLPWIDGFPVVREGRPLRVLPVDWPGLAPDVNHGHRVLTYPYWRHAAEELLAVP